ncbi:MAG TPA: hypothetical protein PLZ67_00260 [Bacteroidales bacterium]|mgnify:CR=1 FL=1|nr:hypothetical protein [Bacteroidales bacterium]
MKTLNAERTINSQLKFIFILFWLATLFLMLQRGEATTIIRLHPWLGGITETTLDLNFSWIVIIRLFFIATSTILFWLISIRNLELPKKDYMMFFILPVIHFTITDWAMGLMASVYWTAFLFILFQLLPGNNSRAVLRKTLTAGVFGGLLLLNGAFALLFFLAGIITMIISQNISFRSTIVWITGFLIPGFFLFLWYFVFDKTNIIFGNPDAFMLEEEMLKFAFPLTFYGCPALLIILSLFAHSRMSESKISVRRSYSAILFSLIALAPAMISSLFNTYILFSIYGLATVFYWTRLMYNTRRKASFIILWLMPFAFPVLYYYLLNYK